MRPTSPVLLGVVFAIFGVAGGFGLSAAYESVPQLPVAWAITVGVVALLVGFLAWTTRNRLRGERGARPPEPLTMARYAALARACSPVGAGLAGGWLGALTYLLSRPGGSAAVSHDRGVSIAGLVTSLLLAAAGLWLEWVCRIKSDRNREPSRPT